MLLHHDGVRGQRQRFERMAAAGERRHNAGLMSPQQGIGDDETWQNGGARYRASLCLSRAKQARWREDARKGQIHLNVMSAVKKISLAIASRHANARGEMANKEQRL